LFIRDKGKRTSEGRAKRGTKEVLYTPQKRRVLEYLKEM
jgi:hypothetical protein